MPALSVIDSSFFVVVTASPLLLSPGVFMSPLTQPCRANPGVVVTLQCRVRAAGRKLRTPPIQRALHVYEREAVANAGRVATLMLSDRDELGDETEDGRSVRD